MKLLTTTSAKLDKSQNDKWLNGILYLDPTYNPKVCQGATEACRASCLINSGRMRMESAVQARKNRTELYFTNRQLFIQGISYEIAILHLKAIKQGKKLAIRLNGTSDLDFSEVYENFPNVQFYEYTKRADLARKLKSFNNVHITMSRTEKTTVEQIRAIIARGINVAVVFDDRNEMPTEWHGMKVINGDDSDRRYEDKEGCIVGLKLKGTNDIKNIARASQFAV